MHTITMHPILCRRDNTKPAQWHGDEELMEPRHVDTIVGGHHAKIEANCMVYFMFMVR